MTRQNIKNDYTIKAIYRFNVISTKILVTFFTAVEKYNLNFQKETQKTSDSQSNPEQKEIMLERLLFQIKSHYRAGTK